MPRFRVYHMLPTTFANDLNAGEATRRRYSYELGTCWSSFLGLQTLHQEAFSNQSEESSYIYILYFLNIWGGCTWASSSKKSCWWDYRNRIIHRDFQTCWSRFCNFLQVFGLQKSDMPSNAPWCVSLTWILLMMITLLGTNISHRKALLKMIFLFPR